LFQKNVARSIAQSLDTIFQKKENQPIPRPTRLSFFQKKETTLDRQQLHPLNESRQCRILHFCFPLFFVALPAQTPHFSARRLGQFFRRPPLAYFSMKKFYSTLTTFLLLFGTLSAQNYTMSNAPINDCSGSFFDPGGASSNYGNNQSFSTTICSDGGATHVRLDFSGASLGMGDQLCFFDGTDATAPQLACADQYPSGPFVVQATAVNPTGCLTIVFTSDGADVGSGWSSSITCVPSCQQVLADLVQTLPAAAPADTGWIDICPGDRVNFTGMGVYPQNGFAYPQSDFTTSFEWNFGDGGIAYGPDVSHVFDEPGGYFVQLVLTDAENCRSTNLVNQRIRVAPRPGFALANTYDDVICAGDTIQLSAIVNTQASNENLAITPGIGGFALGGSRADSLALPDGTGIPYSTSLYFTEFSPGQTLTSINDLMGICVNMEHSYLRDMEIKLTCPNGTEVILHNFGGQTGGGVNLGIPNDNDNFNPIPGSGFDYCWTPNATNPTWLQYCNTFFPVTLPAGDYSSFTPLTALIGCPLNGEWELTVTDLWPADNGYIFSWGIDLNDVLYPDVETFEPGIAGWQWQPNATVFYAQMDSIAASPANAGSASYVFAVTDGFGCVWDTTLRVAVLPFTHPDCFSCQNEYPALRDTAVCAGQSVQFDGSALAGTTQTVRFESTPDYPFGAATHPHGDPHLSPIAVSSLGFNTLTNPIAQIHSVCVDIETDFAADLNIILRAPDNKQLILSTGNGGSGDNYKITCFAPSATVPIIGQPAPFNGTFMPEGMWSSLNNAQINGDWSLVVSDGFGLNQVSRLKSWNIAFNIPNTINYTWASSTGLSCANCPNPVATPSNSNSYIFTAVDNFNCTHRDTVQLGITNFFPAPADLVVSGMTNGNMTWQWDAIAGVTDYEINVNNGGWISVTSTSYTVTGLVPGNAVSVQVRAVGGSANCPPQTATAAQTYVACALEATVAATFPCSCPGAEDGAVDVTVTGQQGQTVFFTNFGSPLPYTNGNLTFYPAGTYQVWAVDAQGCRDTVEFLITQPDTFATTITTVPVVCNGGNTGSASIVASGGTGNLTFFWQRCTGGPLSSGPLALNLTAGCYRVTLTDQIGCTTTRTTTITENPPFMFTTTQDSVQCFGEANGSATVSVSGATPSYTYLWDNGDVTPTSTGQDAGFHAVTVTDGVGCQAVTGIFVIQPPALMIDSTSVMQVSCSGQSDGSATVHPRGGVPPYTYAWSNIPQQTATVTGLSDGNYSVTVTDARGCTALSQALLTSPDTMRLDLVSIFSEKCTSACDGSISVQPAGGVLPYDLTWDNPSVPNDALTATDLCPGSYQVVFTDARGCTVTERFDVDSAVVLTLKFETTTPLCPNDLNGQITSMPEGGAAPYTYAWSTGATTGNIGGLACGDYDLTLTDANNCTISATNTLDCPDAILVDNVQVTPPDCFGDGNGSITVNVSGGTGTLNFSWSDPNQQTGNTAVNLTAGPYSVTISDASNCTLVASATLPQPMPLSAFTTPTSARCIGEASGSISATPSGGTSPYTYAWSGSNDTDFLVENLTPGTYEVTVTDDNGCTFEPSPTIVGEPATPVSISVSQTEVACFGQSDGAATASGSGSNGAPFTYAWSSGATTAVAANLPIGTYQVTVADVRGCTATQFVEIQQHNSIEVTTILVPPTCFGYTDGVASVNLVTGGAGGGTIGNYILQWSLPNTPPGVVAQGIAGNVPFMLTVTDQDGCRGTFGYTLTEPQRVAPNLTATDVVCFGAANGRIEVTSVTGDNPVTTYAWSNQASTATLQNLDIGSYALTVTDTEGCTGTATALIRQPDELDLTFQSKKLICNGDTDGQIVATATGGTPAYAYAWSNSGTEATISNLGGGSYVLTLTDANSCTHVESVDLVDPPPLALDLEPTDAFCHGTYTGRVLITAGGGTLPYDYALGNGTYGGSPIFLALNAGAYEVRVRDANGCTTTGQFDIGQPDPIEVTVTPQDATVVYGEALSLGATATNAAGPVTFTWDPQLLDTFRCVDASCFAIQLQPTISNVLEVVAVDTNGCRGVARVAYEVEKPRGVYVPTGFTPNGDATNDLLQVFGKSRQIKAIRSFRVFDRWGELVYELANFPPNDPNVGWDGTFRGQDCQNGVYVWTLEVEYLDGFVDTAYGQTTLIR
jgi:gliding motility-associated-like protein